MQMLTEWNTARPAVAGWYVASIERDGDARRWWDGRRWSAPVHWGDMDRPCPRYSPTDPHETIGQRARRTPARVGHGDRIEWRGLAAHLPLRHT